MSRSRKRKPIGSVTTSGDRAGNQKKWKKGCNKKLRRSFKDEELPSGSSYKKISGDIWDSPSDGKIYFDSDDPKNYRK